MLAKLNYFRTFLEPILNMYNYYGSQLGDL